MGAKRGYRGYLGKFRVSQNKGTIQGSESILGSPYLGKLRFKI